MFCEYLRINISINSTGRLIDKTHYWGDICPQLLKWRAKKFQRQVTSKKNSDPHKVKTLSAIEENEHQ